MLDWREIDRRLRRVAATRAALDAEEARWLRAAVEEELHLRFQCATMIQYMEVALGYGPKAADERLRVALALEELPAIEAEMKAGRMFYTGVRELTRVVIPRTEAAWVKAATGQPVSRIERLVSGRKKGDLPTDPENPDLRLRTLRFEVTPATFALYRQAQEVLETETGMRMNDDQLLATTFRTIIEGKAGGRDGGRAPRQIVLTVCTRCERGQQVAGGVGFDVTRSAVEHARCDGECIGRVDGDAPERAKQSIPPAVRRQVLRRDGGRCQVPDCRSARFLEVHHVVHREDGGINKPSNLVTLCGAHHDAHHDGQLAIQGTAPRALVFEGKRPHVGIPGAEMEAILTELLGEPIVPP